MAYRFKVHANNAMLVFSLALSCGCNVERGSITPTKRGVRNADPEMRHQTATRMTFNFLLGGGLPTRGNVAQPLCGVTATLLRDVTATLLRVMCTTVYVRSS